MLKYNFYPLSIKKLSRHCNLDLEVLQFFNKGNIDLPSIKEGTLTPAISRKVGAKSMLRTIFLHLKKSKIINNSHTR